MSLARTPLRRPGWMSLFILANGMALLSLTSVQGHQEKDKLLLIGSSGSLTSSSSNVKEDDALETLRSFIKDETGMENKIINEKKWQTVVAKLEKQQLQIGVF